MKYKLTIYPAMGHEYIWTQFYFESKEELMAARNTSADLLLFLQDQAKIMPDYSNMFVCEELINGNWEDTEN